MRFIPTHAHGALDYLTAVALVAGPWLLGFARGGAETWVPVGLGLGVVAYSLVTDYEWGVAPLISMPAHLWLDGANGALLALSPWLFGFLEVTYLPHLAVGLFEIGAACLSRPAPGPRRVAAQRLPSRLPARTPEGGSP